LAVGEKQLQSDFRHVKDAEAARKAMRVMPLESVPGLASRRLGNHHLPEGGDVEDDVEDEEAEEEESDSEFDSFVVRIKEPINYHITEGLMRRLHRENAFRIEDGREATLGPIKVSGIELREPPLAVSYGRQAHFDKAMLEQVGEKAELLPPDAATLQAAGRPLPQTSPVLSTTRRVDGSIGPLAGLCAVIGGAVAFLVLGRAAFSIRGRHYSVLVQSSAAAPVDHSFA
jgi:hypothetical protein